MEVLFEESWAHIIAFCKNSCFFVNSCFLAAFHVYSLKSLFKNLCTWSIKMSVVDSSFSNVERRALSSFYHFFLRFQYEHLQMILRLKSQKNDMKNRKIKSKKLERYLHHLYQFFLQIKLLEQLFMVYTGNSFTGNFYFFIATTVFQRYFSNPLFCVCLFISNIK